jgi:two-component system response regulator MtrA
VGVRSRILLIEDDSDLGNQITNALVRDGYDVTWWTQGKPIERAEQAGLALVILDLMLPGTYGLDILRDLREVAETPVLVLSARNDTQDKVRALQLGADDYMTKPFWPAELLERVRARLRRPTMARGDVLDVGALRVNLAERSVKVDGQAVDLTRAEFEMIVLMARRPGFAHTRERLLEHAGGPDVEASSRSLDSHISRLRKKLGAAVRIETVWGIGYRLSAEGER